jgi:Subtilase family/TIR domain
MYRSLSTVKADLARSEFGITGKDIVWAVVSTGVDGRHPHFARFRNTELTAPLRHMDYSTFASDLARPEDDVVLEERYMLRAPVDVQGQGTAVAGIIAGEGMDPWTRQAFQGMAPQAKILSLRIFDEKGAGSEANVIAALKAIQLINQAGRQLIHGAVVPISVDWDVANYACGHSPVCVEVDRLVNSGVVVVTCSGNRGFDAESRRVVEGGITDPGNADLAITVGASHRTSPQIYGASYFSARGPTADGRRKPDLLAPGEKITVCSPSSPLPDAPPKSKRRNRRQEPVEEDKGEYRTRDGTDVAAAHVAGAAAALLSVRPNFIGKPQDVKDLLLRTAVDLRREVMYQGFGLLDVLAAVREAMGTSAPTSDAAVPLKVFCSYSHLDQALWKEFKAHLSPMERAGRIEIWSDQKIEAGQRWEEEIYQKLNAADIILLLISSYFVDSEFCYSKELKRAVERDAEGTARMVPVRVRPVSLKGTVLAEIQALPPGAKPITSFGDPHEGWAQVAEHLYDIVEKLAGQKKAGPPRAIATT